ncbi:DinB family protein [compost metagenome]
MINLRTANMLAQYKRWADQMLFDSLATLPEGEIYKQRQTIFNNMVGTLNHIHVVDCIWQAHLEHRAHGFTTRHEQPYPELPDLWAAQQAMNAWYIAWSERQTEASLNEPIDFTFTCGDRGTMTAGAMLLHVINHASYHRGWVIQMYFEIPLMPPMTDLPVFLTEVYGK